MDEPLLTARRYLDAYGLGVALTASVVMVFDEALVTGAGRMGPLRLGRERRRHPFRALGRQGGVDVVASGPGAPVAAVTLELLRALGVERVVTVGSAGALGGLPTGATVVVAEAIRDGAPLRYPSDATVPDAHLTQALLEAADVRAVTTVSTDHPFLQTGRIVADHRARAETIEMECAAMFQVADSVGLAVASLLVVSDHYDDVWSPGDRDTARGSLREAVTVAVETLGKV